MFPENSFDRIPLNIILKIKILKADYLSVFVTDMRNLMLYDKSSDYIDKITKSTYNPNESGV